MKNVDDLINIIFGKIDGSQHDATECAKYAAVLQALVAARADARLDAPPKGWTRELRTTPRDPGEPLSVKGSEVTEAAEKLLRATSRWVLPTDVLCAAIAADLRVTTGMISSVLALYTVSDRRATPPFEQRPFWCDGALTGMRSKHTYPRVGNTPEEDVSAVAEAGNG